MPIPFIYRFACCVLCLGLITSCKTEQQRDFPHEPALVASDPAGLTRTQVPSSASSIADTDIVQDQVSSDQAHDAPLTTKSALKGVVYDDHASAAGFAASSIAPWRSSVPMEQGAARGDARDRATLGYLMLDTTLRMTYRGWQHIRGDYPTAVDLLNAGTLHFALVRSDGTPYPVQMLADAASEPTDALGVSLTDGTWHTALRISDPRVTTSSIAMPLQSLEEPKGSGGIWEVRRAGLLALQIEVLMLQTVRSLGRIPQHFDEVLTLHGVVPTDVEPSMTLPAAAVSGVIARVQASPPALHLEVRRPDGIVDSRIIEYLLDPATGTVKIRPVAAADQPEAAHWPVLVALDLTPSTRPEWLVPATR